MRALVIGGSGFIGSHLVDTLISEGQKVRVFDRAENPFRATPKGVEFRQGNFTDTALIAEALADVDVVYHLLSTTVPSTSNLDPVADISGNLIGTVRLLELMRNVGVRRMVYLSSGGTVYGIPQSELISESHLERPISSYGIVKSAIEKYLLMEQHLHGMKPVILRASNPYGPRQGHGGIQGVIGTFLWRTAHEEPIQVWGDGTVVRDFIHVRDLAKLCAICGSGDLTGIFNAGSGEGTSISEILAIVAEVLNREIEVTYTPGRGFDVPRVVLDMSAITERTGWQAETQLKDGILETWRWILEQK
jgi:UDP-glucose 4-epimerase